MQRVDNAGDIDTAEYFVRFSHGDISLLELECLKETGRLKYDILKADSTGARISCARHDALRLISLLGGSYKIARVIGEHLEGSIDQLPLPYISKFEWTVSSYDCTDELALDTRERVREFLKAHDLGKSKYVPPSIDESTEDDLSEEDNKGIHELKASDVARRILPDGSEGIDFLVHGGIEGSPPFFGYTIGLSDVEGFEKRDFDRPYQDPRITLGTRIARIMCNLATPAHHSLLADPFCGLGTILQEALVLGHSVVGVDKNTDNVFKAKSNLNWLVTAYRLPRSNIVRMLRSSARRLDQLPIPKADCIATEPILLPTYAKNPSRDEASDAMRRSGDIYDESLQGMAGILSGSRSRICLITPTLFDSRGRTSTISLVDSAARAGLKEYWPKSARKRPPYPVRILTSKRKTVQRNVMLYTLA